MTQHRRAEQVGTDEAAIGDAAKDALVPFLVSRLLMVAVAVFVNSYLLPWAISHDLEVSGIDLLTGPWNRFDASFFLEVAQHGYGDASSATWGVFPLYPLLVAVIGSVLGGSTTAYLLAGLGVSFLAAAGASVLLYLLVRAEWGVEVARRATLYFAFVPFGFYLAAPYADALFVLLVIGTLLLTRQHRWLAAGVVGALAATTRAPGALLAVVLVAELVTVHRGNRGTGRRTPFVRALAGACLVPTGLLAFLGYAWVSTGSWTTPQTVSANAWGRDVSDPIGGLHKLAETAHWGEPASYLFSPVNIALLLVFLVVLSLTLRTLPLTYGAFTAVLLAGAVSYGTLQGFGREVLPVVTGVVLLAIATRTASSLRHQMVLAGFAVANAVLLVCFVLNVPALA